MRGIRARVTYETSFHITYSPKALFFIKSHKVIIDHSEVAGQDLKRQRKELDCNLEIVIPDSLFKASPIFSSISGGSRKANPLTHSRDHQNVATTGVDNSASTGHCEYRQPLL